MALAITKSGCEAIRSSTFGSSIAPSLTTESSSSKSRLSHASLTEATSFPPARSHTSEKLPRSEAVLSADFTVTLLPSASVNVTLSCTSALALSEFFTPHPASANIEINVVIISTSAINFLTVFFIFYLSYCITMFYFS